MNHFQISFPQKIKLFITVVLISLMVMVAFDASATIVADFNETQLHISSPKLNLFIDHGSVVRAELIDMPDFGTMIGDSYSHEAYCAGTWENETWGAYTLCVIPSNQNAILVEVANDGFVVFSCTTDEKTAALFASYSAYLQS